MHATMKRRSLSFLAYKKREVAHAVAKTLAVATLANSRTYVTGDAESKEQRAAANREDRSRGVGNFSPMTRHRRRSIIARRGPWHRHLHYKEELLHVIPLGPYTTLHLLGMYFDAGASICSSSVRERRRLATAYGRRWCWSAGRKNRF